MRKDPTIRKLSLISLCLAVWLYAVTLPAFADDEAQKFSAWLPQITVQEPASFVDTQDRQTVVDLYRDVYAPTANVPLQWTGSHDSCNAGDTSDAYKDAILARINFFRAMAGVPANIVFSPERNADAQEAALMMSRNDQLSHDPPSSWVCYTNDGASAAGASNLTIGLAGVDAVASQMEEHGTNNYKAGHRRWILCPQSQVFGTGDVEGTADRRFLAANSLWVIDQEHYYDPRPTTREAFVAWPPPGYVPQQFVYARWSFSFAGADFSRASVSMSSNGQSIGVRLEKLAENMCEPTLVWVPEVDWASLDVSADHSFDVTVRGVRVGGQSRTFSYTVTVIGL